MTGAPALFTCEGDLLVPSGRAAGPWDPGALHGGSAAAVMARAMESLDPDPEMPFARCTFEFTRPVPVAPLRVTARVSRPGRRIQVVEAEIAAAGEVVARGTGLRIRAGDSDVPDGVTPAPAPLPPPGHGAPPAGIEAWGHGLIRWMDLQVVSGEVIQPGAAAAWFRVPGELVEGETPSALQRVVTAADFGNGLSGVLDFRTHLYINPDLTVYLHRYPAGDWVGLESQTWVHAHGVGLAESLLWDEEGPIGRSMQALLVGKRG